MFTTVTALKKEITSLSRALGGQVCKLSIEVPEIYEAVVLSRQSRSFLQVLMTSVAENGGSL